MNAWKVTKKISLSAAFVASVAILLYGCLPLQNTLDENNPLGGGQNGVLGVTSADGNGIGFAFAGRTRDASTGDNYTIQVKNSDGSYSDCTFQEGSVVDGSDYNSLGLLIDESGSMGNAYPPEEYGDICPTCPHDPTRLRADACEKLIQQVHSSAPESRIGVMVFGPAPDDGMMATRILHDFSVDTRSLVGSLSAIDGTQMNGTPLWDSLYEHVGATDGAAVDLEAHLRSRDVVEEDGSEVEVKRVLLVISDGDDRDSVNWGLSDVITRAQEAGVVIHAIGLGPMASATEDPALLTRPELADEQIQTVQNLQRLAEGTGGFYASVHDASALTELYSAIAAGLTNGYALETWECLPDGREPKAGAVLEGRIVDADGNTIDEWSMVTPD